jgi:hypothetical protein
MVHAKGCEPLIGRLGSAHKPRGSNVTLYWLFNGGRQRPRRRSFEETFGDRMPNGPPPPSRYYMLSPSGFGPSGEVWSYDIFYRSSGKGAGSLIFQAGDEKHYAFWKLDLPHDPQMPPGGHVFKRRTEALSWLGNPKIQRAVSQTLIRLRY